MRNIQLKSIKKFALSLLIVIVVFSFATVLLLTLFRDLKDPRQMNKMETAAQHLHPHADSIPNTLTRALEAEQNTPENEVESPTNDKGETQVKGFLESFKPIIDLRDTDTALAQKKLHAIAEELGNGDPEWTEYFHLTGHSLLAQPAGEPPGAYLALEDAVCYFELINKLFGETEQTQEQLKETRARLRWNKETEEVNIKQN